MVPQREAPKEFVKRAEVWLKYFRSWLVAYYVLAIASTASATAVAATHSVLGCHEGFGWLYTVLSWLSALSIALLSLLKPWQRAVGYINAWRVMDIALDRYRYNLSLDASQLIDAKASGERMIATMSHYASPTTAHGRETDIIHGSH
jgi:hypothetical protein